MSIRVSVLRVFLLGVDSAGSGPRVWLHYFPIYISAFIIFVVYGSVFWKLQRHVHHSQGTSQSQSRTVDEQQAGRNAQVNNVANKLLWCVSPAILPALANLQPGTQYVRPPPDGEAARLTQAAAYICLILPISIARVVVLRGTKVPGWFTNMGITILFLSGVRAALPARQPRD